MKTVLTISPDEAAQYIKKGGIVAFPTETVYGLGASVFDENAIKNIFTAKKRPPDNPLIAHVGSIDQIYALVSEVNDIAQKLITEFFPGPLTLVLPKAKDVPLIATANLETIGVRMPRNDLAQELLRAAGVPLVAPSANLSGKPSSTTWQAVHEDLDGRIDCILQGETTEIGLESTVLDCTGEIPMILRTGAVTIEHLKTVVPETRVFQASEKEQPKSPGMKHKHYSPEAKVVLVSAGNIGNLDSGASAFIGVTAPLAEFDLVQICESKEEYARSLFVFFRECDKAGIQHIYCEEVEENNIGTALMDRLRRASGQ